MMKSANECSALLAVPYPLRDVDWRARFKAAVVTASLRAADPASFHGPDGFPYLTLKPSGIPPNPVFATVARFAVEKISGLALLTDDHENDKPAFVFTHGDLVAHTNYGDIDVAPDEVITRAPFAGKTVSKLPDGRIVGSASDTFLPATTRTAMARLLSTTYGIPKPRIGALFDPQFGLHVAVNLGEARKLDQSPQNIEAALSLLKWFLPRAYQLCSLPASIPVRLLPKQ
jgi:hypothetical protein